MNNWTRSFWNQLRMITVSNRIGILRLSPRTNSSKSLSSCNFNRFSMCFNSSLLQINKLFDCYSDQIHFQFDLLKQFCIRFRWILLFSDYNTNSSAMMFALAMVRINAWKSQIVFVTQARSQCYILQLVESILKMDQKLLFPIACSNGRQYLTITSDILLHFRWLKVIH